MIRIAIAVAAIAVFCLGVWEFVLAFQWPGKKTDWKVADGWIADVGGEYTFNLPGKARNIDFLIKDQQVTYVFFVGDQMYFKRLELPFNLAPVQAALKKPLSVEDLENFQLPNEHLPAARFNPETRQLEVMTDPGATISFSHITTHSGVKWAVVGREEWDRYMARIKVRYNPANPDQSITDPDLLNGTQTLIVSGLILVVVSLIMGGGVVFHSTVMQEDVPDPFAHQRR